MPAPRNFNLLLRLLTQGLIVSILAAPLSLHSHSPRSFFAAIAKGLSLLLPAILFRALRRTSLADPALETIPQRIPIPLWRTDAAGRVLWSNPACNEIWPSQDPPGLPGRIKVSVQGLDRHFDIGRTGDLLHALPTDALIQAETSLRDMVQAMAKTFAQLPTGLAVFDRNRHLQSFNPALAQLTRLSPEFLSRRPSLVTMLDRMRDQNMVPEPKNWKDWRRQIAEMERAATHGQFAETWSLPGGQTYRVTGRRHPDGGLALMIDDISTEIIRSRRYRADLELCQGVVDTLSDGIAVFAATGQLVMSNAAYATLWNHNPGEELAPTGIRQLADHWRACSAPTSLWSEAEDFMTTLDDRHTWQAEARLTDGRLIHCRFSPLANRATLVSFREVRIGTSPLAIATAGA